MAGPAVKSGKAAKSHKAAGKTSKAKKSKHAAKKSGSKKPAQHASSGKQGSKKVAQAGKGKKAKRHARPDRRASRTGHGRCRAGNKKATRGSLFLWGPGARGSDALAVLVGPCRGVTLDGRLGPGDFAHDAGRQFHRDGLAVIEHHFDFHAVLQVVDGVAHVLGFHLELVVLGVHEHDDLVHLVVGLEDDFGARVVQQALHLHAHGGAVAAAAAVFGLQDDHRVLAVHDDVAGADFLSDFHDDSGRLGPGTVTWMLGDPNCSGGVRRSVARPVDRAAAARASRVLNAKKPRILARKTRLPPGKGPERGDEVRLSAQSGTPGAGLGRGGDSCVQRRRAGGRPGREAVPGA
ncbi:hypothetical protein Ddc_20443 [Ditylenchus destructor]|nr:hypothetical protein Ddc_20443 [Ditylenchus destructor]